MRVFLLSIVSDRPVSKISFVRGMSMGEETKKNRGTTRLDYPANDEVSDFASVPD